MSDISSNVSSARSTSDTVSPELTSLTISELSEYIRAGRITPSQITRACLDRILALDSKLNAFITLMAEQALAQARVLDSEAAQGKFRSPLHGIPIALKDAIDTAGVLTTGGSALLKDRIPQEDAHVVTRLKAAGAIVLGKTNLQEFGMGGLSATSHCGDVHNPWNLEMKPGGSSSGSAAAVAADFCPGALGTDTGGSMRIPAAYCGVVGLKPTYGLVSKRGVLPTIPSLDVCGPMGRTAKDVALILGEIAGYDRLDVASENHAREDYLAQLGRPMNSFSLGIAPDLYFEDMDAEVGQQISRFLSELASCGVTVKKIEMPSYDGLAANDMMDEYHVFHRGYFPAQANLYTDRVREDLDWSLRYLNDGQSNQCNEKVADYIEWKRNLELARRVAGDIFIGIDGIIMPTVRVMPPRLDTLYSDYKTINQNCFLANLLGFPAISFPCGFASSGLPVGVMVMGNHFQEAKLLALVHAYEQMAGRPERKPIL